MKKIILLIGLLLIGILLSGCAGMEITDEEMKLKLSPQELAAAGIMVKEDAEFTKIEIAGEKVFFQFFLDLEGNPDSVSFYYSLLEFANPDEGFNGHIKDFDNEYKIKEDLDLGEEAYYYADEDIPEYRVLVREGKYFFDISVISESIAEPKQKLMNIAQKILSKLE